MKMTLPRLALALVLASTGPAGLAQMPAGEKPVTPGTPSAIPPTLKQIGPDLFMITGRGANVAVRRTDAGYILIDNKVQYQVVFDELMDLIRKRITDKPVALAFVLHHHADHSGNNARVLVSGADLVGQVNMVETLRTYRSRIAPVNPSPPNVTFKTSFERVVGGKKVVAYYWGPAHTNSDSVVYFPDRRVVVAGDILHNDGEPSVDALEGKGSLLGLAARLDNLLALDFAIAVPGHGDNVMTRAEVELYRNRIRALVERGKRAVACGVGPEGLRDAMRSDDLGFRLVGHLWTDPAYVKPIHEELVRAVKQSAKAAICKTR